jgi:hypothetical protein
MTRERILGVLDPDLACAVAVGLVEHRLVAANLEAVTLHDARMQPVGTQRDWLGGADPLDVATREYLTARRDAAVAGSRGRSGSGAWDVASMAKKRDEANRKANEARLRVKVMLEERGVLARARAEGLPVVG